MDLSADSRTLPTYTAGGGPALEQELSLSNACCKTESGGTIILQLLEFKTHLLEAVEELHIRRDVETRFENQISKLVLEKQELEWEKESLQHQIETVSNQHTESLINVKKQLQAKIINIEEQKGKYQVSAELKDKEINNLKEELKSLQLLKYNLEKRSSELEQKLAFQSRSKDCHLNQLGEVEKRFSALSRQCAMVKQAHEKLEQNVDKAVKIQKLLTTANEKQEATIVSLKKELEEVSHKLIKAKMSSVRHEEAHSATGREQHCQQLHRKLSTETEMNKKLMEESVSARAEKQEVMRSLQHTTQLLLSQTQTASRVELELQTQRAQYQALKQEQRVMRERSQAAEDEVARLMESDAASKHSWDKEKSVFLGCIKSERQDLRAVKEAHEELRREHTELSLQAKVQAQHIYELEMRGGGQSPSDPTEDIRGEGTLNEPVSSSDMPLSSGSLQHLASAQSSNPDGLEDTGVVTERDATGATGVSTVLSHGQTCVDGSLDSHSDEGNEGISEREQGWQDDAKQVNYNGDEEKRLEGQQQNGEEEAVKEREVAEKSRTLGPQTTDRSARREGRPGSAEDAGGSKRPEAETEDGAKGEGTCGAEGRGKTGPRDPGTQIAAQTSTDKTAEKSDAQQAVDLTDTEPADRSQSLLQNVGEEDVVCSHVNAGSETPPVLCRDDEHRGVGDEPSRAVQEAQSLRRDAVQTLAESVTPSPIHHVLEETTEKKPSKKSAADMSAELSRPPDQSGACSSQIGTAPSGARSDGVGIRELATAQTRPGHPSDIPSDMKQTDALQSPEIWGRAGQSSVNTRGIDACEAAQKPTDQCPLKDAGADAAGLETGSSREEATADKIDSTGEAKMTKSDADLKPPVYPSHESDAAPETGGTKCHERSPAKEILRDEANVWSLLDSRPYRPSVDRGSARGRVGSSGDKADVSVPHQFVQGSPASEPNTSGPGDLLRHPPGTSAMFLKSTHSKVPLVVTGPAASTLPHRQGWRGALGETAAADRESRASLSVMSSPVSRLLWQSAPGCSRAPSSAAGPSSESNWEPFGSLEREDQQSSFRAQISKIEHFLNIERLRLPKRRRTDN